MTDAQIEEKFFNKGKPGRKSLEAATPVDAGTPAQALAEVAGAADAMAGVQAAYGQERDLVNQLLGQAQMASAIAKFSETVSTSKLAYVKENKLYRAIKGQKSGNGFDFLTGTWEEFCGLLGVTSRKVDEDISNLQAFGEDALETMSRMGIGYRELRQYRRLPDDQKQALIEVARAGDKECFVELAEEIIAKHAKEKEQLTTKVQQAAEQLAAKDRVLADNAAKITEQAEALEMPFVPTPGSEATTRQEQALLKALDQATSAAYLAMHSTFKAADAALSDSGAREAVQARGRHAVEFLAQQLADMADEFGIAVDLESRLAPTWLTEEALAALEARNAAAGAVAIN